MTQGTNEFVASAPARANIIGEHTDYASNCGHVLPTPLPLYTTVRVKALRRSPGEVTVSSTSFNEQPCTRLLSSSPMAHWSDYVVGCLQTVAAEDRLPALKVEVESEIQMGCGIASSAALCVALLRAVKQLICAHWIDEEIALMAYRAEHDYVGVPCGPMDQFASSLGRPGQAMLLDTKTLSFRNYRLDQRMAVMVVDSGTRRGPAAGDWLKKRLQRQAECREARNRLGVRTLCELGGSDLPMLVALPSNIARRAWHVITENMRVSAFVNALERGDLEYQADLLEASHISQRDNFECSTPEIDALVESSKRFGVRGARLVGGGFGGAIMALVPREQVADWWAFVSSANPKSRLISKGEFLEQDPPVPSLRQAI